MSYQKRGDMAGKAVSIPLFSSAWMALFALLRTALQS